MERRSVRRVRGGRVVVALAALVLVLVLMGQARPERALAAGAGVFTLDAPAYFVQEGSAVAVTVVRTEGTTLTEDVTVTLELEGGTVNEDYPAATITQLATFTKGTNPTQVTVFFQTLNQARISHNTGEIQVFLRSVSSGTIGTIDSAPLTIYGNGAPRVFSVTPRSGEHASGSYVGTTITVHGVNFTTSGTTTSTVVGIDLIPVLGGSQPPRITAPDFQLSSPNQLSFRIPMAANAGFAYHVQVVTIVPSLGTGNCIADPLNTGCSLLTADDTVAVVGEGEPTVTGLSPKSGPTFGGTEVRIFGSNFDAFICANGVLFGGIPATSCTLVSPTVVEVVSPEAGVGPVNVRVTNSAGQSPPTPENVFTYTGAPVITSISPSVGPAIGGTTVTIIGSGFATPGGTITGVKFGGDDAVTFTMVNNTTVTAVSPQKLDGGTVQITVTHSLTGSSGFTTAANFTYFTGPIVQNLSPDNGSPAGGTTVTISGVGFAPGATVTFGGVNALFVVVKSSSVIEATSPPGTGTVQVIVTVNSTSSPVSPESEFQYSGPRIDNVTPNAGPTVGGTTVVIQGNNFTQAALVKFGEVPAAEMTFISPAMIEAKSPASPTGSFAEVHITITTPSGTTATGDQTLFTYTDGPIISGVNPGNGPISGGTIVVITGSNFADGAKVMFGDVEALAFNFNSQTQVTALTPPVPESGPVPVRVTTAVGTSPVSELSEFVYDSGPPIVTAITPNTGTVFGGQTVVISGRGFLGASCPGSIIFGTVEVDECTVINDTTITVVTPPNPSGPAVVIVKTVYGSSEIAEHFTYGKPAGGGGSGGGGGGGSGGGGIGDPVPPSGSDIMYTLNPTWNLLVWRGADGMSVREALVGTNGVSLYSIVSAIYTYSHDEGRWLGYFTGAEDIPGANDFAVLDKDRVYWVAISVSTPIQWHTTDN